MLKQDVSQGMNDMSFLESEISKWKTSPERREVVKGFLYYSGHHDILHKKRMAIGKGGKLEEIKNVPNRKDIDNQYAIAVDEKANYLLGKPFTIDGDNEEYVQKLRNIFDKKMMKKIKALGKKSLNGGIAWLYPYYDSNGNFNFKTFSAYEILPFWKDSDHEELDYAIHRYLVSKYEGRTTKLIEKIEIFKIDGVYRYELSGGSLVVDEELGAYSSYMEIYGMDYNWDTIPLIPFKYNDDEIPLIRHVKSLQDAINEMLSFFHNNMLEDNRNTILIIENYDGTDLGEFRHNLSEYGAVKVRSGDGARGGVSSLSVEVNADNYQAILQLLKDKLIENARSFDGKQQKSGNPNEMNILSMYQDIDIDTNDFEAEYQAAIEQMIHFINIHLSLTGQGNYFEEKVNIVFNRDLLMNKTELMDTLLKAGVKISQRTLLSQVPFIDDVDRELELVREENESNINDYANAFKTPESQLETQIVDEENNEE